MNNYSKIADSIRDTYENNLFTLRLYHQKHYSQRMYRITGSDRYIQPIVVDYRCKNSQTKKYIDNLGNKNFINKESKRLVQELSTEKQKGRERKKFFQKKHKEFLLLDNVIFNVSDWKSLNIEKVYQDKAIKELKKINFDKYFFDEDFIKCFGTQLVNSVYYLDKLNIADYKKDIKEKYIKLFMGADDNKLSELEYNNKVYGLTHFIIADSHYYQRWTSKEKYNWILDYFTKNIDLILKRTNVDIISELGLCFILCKHFPQDVLSKVKARISKEYNPKLGFIPRGDKNDLGKSEHTNIIAYMVLKNIKKLFKGPNLSKYIKNY